MRWRVSSNRHAENVVSEVCGSFPGTLCVGVQFVTHFGVRPREWTGSLCGCRVAENEWKNARSPALLPLMPEFVDQRPT